MNIKQFSVGLLSLACFTLAADLAQAVQTHGGLEGLVSHQIGHLLFILGMGYLLFRLSLLGMKGPGWLEFRFFLWLLIAWNLLTFAGHWLNEGVGPEKFIRSGGRILSFTVTSYSDAFFYLSRLDHLLLVPAFIFLLLALRKWRSQP